MTFINNHILLEWTNATLLQIFILRNVCPYGLSFTVSSIMCIYLDGKLLKDREHISHTFLSAVTPFICCLLVEGTTNDLGTVFI